MNSVNGRALRILRIYLDYSQRQVAKRAGGRGLSDQSISNWEKGDTVPEEGNLRKLLKVYGITPLQFADLTRILEADGEDAMTKAYERYREAKADVEDVTAPTAVAVLRWVIALEDGQRKDVLNKLNDEDHRLLIWSLADLIKPLPVGVMRPLGSAPAESETAGIS